MCFVVLISKPFRGSPHSSRLSYSPLSHLLPSIKCGHIHCISYLWEHLTRHTGTLVLGSHMSRWDLIRNWRRDKCLCITSPTPLSAIITSKWRDGEDQKEKMNKGGKSIVKCSFSSKVQFNSVQRYEMENKTTMENGVLSYSIIFSYYIRIFT